MLQICAAMILVVTFVAGAILEPPPGEADGPADAYGRLVEAEHWRDAQAAGEALLEFGDAALPLLLGGAERHEDDAIRRRCYELVMRAFPVNPRAVRIITNDGLADGSQTIRYMCAFHLGEHRIYGSFRRLERVMGDPENTLLTRLGAAKSLGELGEPGALPLLYDGLASDDFMPRYLANLGIKALTGRDLGAFDYDHAEGAYVSGGLEAKRQRRPIEDAETRARRHTAIAAWARWLRDERPELYKHLSS